MALPQLTAADVEAIVSNCKVVAPSLGGGQKIVYPCCIDGLRCAVKFILLGELKDDLDGDVQSKIDTVRARVEREIAIMRKINSPNIVRMGDLELTPVTFHEQSLLYYSEEWVEGESLSTILRDSKLPVCEALKLCTDITQAIYELWSLNKVHRDIKPQNIMRQHSDGTYILLDLGLALDLEDKSLTQYGYVPGTKTYFSPEQLDINHKRDIDFRSDLFSLGIVLYQSLTGVHPFYKYGMSDQELFSRIITQQIIPPSAIDANIPPSVSSMVCRLLSKQPSGRYRKCSLLIDEVTKIRESLEV